MIQKGTFYVLESEAEAIRLLTEKAAELGRLPDKGDFPENMPGAIKAKLGPWPRALEKAGLKKVSQTYLDRKARQRAKRKQRHKKKGGTRSENRKVRESV